VVDPAGRRGASGRATQPGLTRRSLAPASAGAPERAAREPGRAGPAGRATEGWAVAVEGSPPAPHLGLGLPIRASSRRSRGVGADERWLLVVARVVHGAQCADQVLEPRL